MKLVLIRHGQTEWNLEHRIQGWKNSSLTPEAEQMLRHLSLPELVSPVIYSSDLERSVNSAQILADRYCLDVVTDTRLRERKFGVLEGKIIDKDLELASFWHAYHHRYQRKLDSAFGAEPELDFELRILSFLNHIIQINQYRMQQEKEIVIVSHGEWIRAFINIINGVPSWHEGRGIENNLAPIFVEFPCQPGGFPEISDVIKSKETA